MKGLIGVVHLAPMPGDPLAAARSDFESVSSAALADAEAYCEGGVDALIIENFGSTPFFKGGTDNPLPPHQVAAMAVICSRVAGQSRVPIGVNCLRNDARAALAIARVCGLSFIRVNVHVGAYVCDQGVIEGEAASTLRYRDSLGAHDVAILADVLVKHATPLAPLSATQATHDTLVRGLADGVIVTGVATGAPVDLATLQEVRLAAGNRPVYVGSGFTVDNAQSLAPLCDGAIVGTACKRDGNILAPVDPRRVAKLRDQTAGLFWPREPTSG